MFYEIVEHVKISLILIVFINLKVMANFFAVV